MKPKTIRTQPVPMCPECCEKMVLRRPKPNQHFDPFWGCSQYPECKGTLNIKEDGTPDEDRFEVDIEY